MRDRTEGFMVLPFSAGCISQSSVAVSENQPKKLHIESSTPSSKGSPPPPKGGGGESLDGGKMKNSLGFLSLPRSNVSVGLQRLIKSSLKGLSQLFTMYKEGEEEMEIGLPTDVKHVAHIGWDDSNNAPTMNGWDKGGPAELLSLTTHPSHCRQFELAMAAQADAPLAAN